MSDKLEVWLDVDFIEQPQRVGSLFHDRGQVRFSYESTWLQHPACFALDAELTLDAAPFFPNAEAGNFGIFLDSAPDRWGQTLMKRREMLEAKQQQRPIRTLHAWDYLLGVQDFTRQGALRFRHQESFVSQSPLPAPPLSSLRELEQVAYEITRKRIENLDALQRWLSVLVAPGASLGGARPKANFTDQDGSLWIAKFPARDDDIDVAAWEWVVHRLAKQAQIDVPDARLMQLGSDYHTFCVQRFDRQNQRRVFYASALTLLNKQHSEGSSYLELAQFLQHNAPSGQVNAGLAQLFRRVVFNVVVANRDDHLRNHGFLMRRNGWELAPAFDINPNLHKAEHVLNLDDSSNQPDLHAVLSTADWYALTTAQAQKIVDEILVAVQNWRQIAQTTGLSAGEIEMMADAFMVI